MILTVFRSHLRPAHADEYADTAARMSELASAMPGSISHKGFTAADGERVTIVEFADEASQGQWALPAAQGAGQLQGRKGFYSENKLQGWPLMAGSRLAAPVSLLRWTAPP